MLLRDVRPPGWDWQVKDWCRKCALATTAYPSRVCNHCAGLCNHDAALPAYIRTRDGRRAPFAVCLDCGRRVHRKLDRVLDVCVKDAVSDTPCARCGGTGGTQEHHWAPWALFADAAQWPTAELCIRCHNLWHNTLRAGAGVSLDPPSHLPGWSPDELFAASTSQTA